jgi:phage recombination protein Bet
MMDTALSIREDFKITADDVRKYFAPNATEKEFGILMGICHSFNLNPFKREVHFVKYGTAAASIITGYEIYLKRAERTGKLDGWKCWIEKDDMGEKAVIEIKRKDHSMPIRWEVYRKEFDKGQSTWKSMPSFMLKKVAIAQGFRLAFPDDCGGMPYIPEEMPSDKGGGTSEALPQAAIVEAEVVTDPPPLPAPPVSPDAEKGSPDEKDKLATPGQVKQIQIIMNKRGFTERQAILDDLTGFCGRIIKSSKEITFDEAHQFIEANIGQTAA